MNAHRQSVPATRRSGLLARIAAASLLAASGLLVAPAGAQEPARPPSRAQTAAAGPRPRVLIVSGGCCHDYALQDKILMDAMARTLPIDWTVVVQGGTGTNAQIPLYENPDWARGFDLVVHNECYADVSDEAFIGRITKAHRDNHIPAVVIHCSMHSYRAAQADLWREFLGVTSRRHTRAHNVAVTVADASHPVTAGMPATWSTPVDELYVIEKLWPGATALATAVSPEEGHATYPVLWAHEYGGARVVGTTLGHGNATWEDPVFRGILQRAVLWTLKKN